MCKRCESSILEIRDSARDSQILASGFFNYVEGIFWLCDLQGEASTKPFVNGSEKAGYSMVFANYSGEPCKIDLVSQFKNNEVGFYQENSIINHHVLKKTVTIGETYLVDDLTKCHEIIYKINKPHKSSSETISTQYKYDIKSLTGDSIPITDQISRSFQL